MTETPSLRDFYRADSPDLFAKCRRFGAFVQGLERERLFQTQYRVMLTSGLDHRVTVRDPDRGGTRTLVCFDSNSYLGLHRHPRVVGAVRAALSRVGYGTPSAQVLCGTNRYLRELEETLCAFHGREAALVFPSGYAANLGAITGLLRERDLVARDRFSHASIHDACRASDARRQHVYPHLDVPALDDLLTAAADDPDCQGKLVVTDGVFSMHGRVAPLPALVATVRRHGARLMLDEAHATGVLGATGRGSEELHGLPGAVDVLMGTFSKAPGTVGGYVCGCQELIEYLRFYAHAGLFTAALPAALCAGVTEAYRVMAEEPRHRERLWRNVRALVPALRDAGLHVIEGGSPIVPVFLGSSRLLWLFCRDLFDAGVKCGSAVYPAVPPREALVRLAVNARHTRADLDFTVGVFERLGRKYSLLRRSPEELCEIGDRLESAAAA